MKAICFSKNAKLNRVLNSIYNDLLRIHKTQKESIEEIRHYVSLFRIYTDYNLYQYGNMLISTKDIRDLYKEYSSLKKATDEKIKNIYMKQIRYVVNFILKNNL